MEDIKKEIAELKGLVSKLLEIQVYEHNMKYGYLNKPLTNTSHYQKD